MKSPFELHLGLASLFSTRPDSKHFQFCKTPGICSNYSTLPLYHETSQYINKQAWLSFQKIFIYKSRQQTDLIQGWQFSSPVQTFPRFLQISLVLCCCQIMSELSKKQQKVFFQFHSFSCSVYNRIGQEYFQFYYHLSLHWTLSFSSLFSM